MLNRLFLGGKSALDITVNARPDKIKLYLSINLQNQRPKQFASLGIRASSGNSKLTYITRSDQIRIYYSDYPAFRFKGTLSDTGNKTRVRGILGEAEWGWWFQIAWIGFFAGVYLNWLMGGRSYRGVEITIYFALFGLIVLFFKIISLRKKVALLRREIENLVDAVNDDLTIK